jgi:phosphoribosylaminoimidazole carboxylase PurE protein
LSSSMRDSREGKESIMPDKRVLIVMGSKRDEPVMLKAAQVLDEFEISYSIEISSAHRHPEKTKTLTQKAEKEGVKVIIAGAGMAAHLPGVIASHTTLPVIGIPLSGSALFGLDSLLSIVQMPSGIPVATVAIGEAGAKNAAILAAEILALSDDRIKKKLEKFRKDLGTK